MDVNVAGDVVLAPFAVPNFEIKPSKIDLHRSPPTCETHALSRK